MARRRFSNLLALAVLSCLAERPMHPYEISQTLRHRGKEQSIKLNYGALYSVVESLARAGLIEPPRDRARGPAPRAHRLRDHRGGRCRSTRTGSRSCSPRRCSEYHSLEAGARADGRPGPRRGRARCSTDAQRQAAGRARPRSTRRCGSPRRWGSPRCSCIEERVPAGAAARPSSTSSPPWPSACSTDELGGVAGWRRVHELLAQGHDLRGDLPRPRRAPRERTASRSRPS